MAEERVTPPRRDWSAIPELALSAVALLLRSLRDFSAFASVCRCWRRAAKAAEGDFMASLPPFLFWDLRKRGLICPTDGRFYWRKRLCKGEPAGHRVAGFSHGHLILLSSWQQRPCLLNTFTCAQIQDFPCSPPNVQRALLSSPPASPDFALVVFDKSTLRYCRLGDNEWSFLYDRVRSPEWIGDVEDVAFVGRKGYVLCAGGRLATFDLAAGPELVVVECQAPPIALWNTEWCKSLIVYKGELFAFAWGIPVVGDQMGFLIFQFDAENYEWRRLESIGDRALFVNHGKGGVFVDNYAKWGGSGDAVYFLKRHSRSFSVNVIHMGRANRRIDLFYHHFSGANIGNFDGIWVMPTSCI